MTSPAWPILPGSTIGIVGAGQLGRMSAIAARRLGYRVIVLDPTPASPAAAVADEQIVAGYDDVDAARAFARRADVLTYEFENIPAETLHAIADLAPVRPSPEVLHATRHRVREKTALRQAGVGTADFVDVPDRPSLDAALDRLGTPAILKTCELGYDGKGQCRINSSADADQAWEAIAGQPAVLEAVVPFDREISVIAARGPDGQAACFDPVENVHSRHILDVTTAPASIPADVAREAVRIAGLVAQGLDVVGLIAIEMFVVGDRVLVNEVAPRPHNSGHHTIDACVTSQFEQHIRAVCGLPLGDPALRSPACMVNLLGDLWEHGEPRWDHALEDPGVKLHLYGKAEARPGRKMGHLTVTDADPAQARRRALAARDRLTSRD